MTQSGSPFLLEITMPPLEPPVLPHGVYCCRTLNAAPSRRVDEGQAGRSS